MARIIRERMEDRKLDPCDIHPRFRFQNVYGYGRVTCKECEDSWTSDLGWIRIDLEHQYISRRWKQRHKECGGEAVPYFFLWKLKAMIELVLNRYEKLVETEGHRPGRSTGSNAATLKNHHHVNCEKCHWGDCQEDSRQCCIKH